MKTLPLKVAYQWASERGLHDEIDQIKAMEIEWDLPYTSSLRRGYIIDLFQRKGLFEEFKKECWPEGNTSSGDTATRRFLRIRERHLEYLQGNGDIGDDISEDDISEQAFAAEADLRDFLASNLEIIEPELRLYTKDNQEGIEYPVESGRIDILAIDKDNKFVIIELKLSRGRNKALGQLLYYMGWVDENLGNKPCRGLIIAREISHELRMAVRRVQGVQIFQYHLQVSLEEVK